METEFSMDRGYSMPAGPEYIYSAKTAALGKYQDILEVVSNEKLFSQIALFIPILEALIICKCSFLFSDI